MGRRVAGEQLSMKGPGCAGDRSSARASTVSGQPRGNCAASHDASTIYSTDVTSPSALPAVLVSKYEKVMKVLECVQRRAAKQATGWRCVLGEKAESAWLPHLEKGRQRGDLTVPYSVTRRECRVLLLGISGRMGTVQSCTRLDTEKKFFTVRVVKHWNSLLSQVADAPDYVSAQETFG